MPGPHSLFLLPLLFFPPRPALAPLAGGWAVITVEHLPEYVEAGRPVTLTFMVRQHGVTPLKGLSPRLEARAGSLTARAAATAGKKEGQYLVTFTLPQAGEWTVTIHSGFGNSKLTLLPWRAVEAGKDAGAVQNDAGRGRQLFVAKGCVSCHIRGELGGGEESLAIGPDLTGKRFAAEYLKMFLANPSATKPPARGAPEMPTLGLKEAEIAALIAFINSER